MKRQPFSLMEAGAVNSKTFDIRSRFKVDVISAMTSTLMPCSSSRCTCAWISVAQGAKSATVLARSMRPGMSCELPAEKLENIDVFEHAGIDAVGADGDAPLLMASYGDERLEKKIVAIYRCDLEMANIAHGASSGRRLRITALAKFMPVTIPVRSPSVTNSVLLLLSRMAWPASPIVRAPSMKIASAQRASRTRKRKTDLSPLGFRCDAKASSRRESSE